MASIVKSLRISQLERWMACGMTQTQIADKLGVSRATVARYVALRRKKMLATLPERQAIIFDMLIKTSLDDLEALGRLIDQEEKFNLVVTDAYGKRIQIARNLANFTGLSSNVKVQNIQNNLQLNDNRKEVTMNGPVQIIVEGNSGEFDPNYGQVRMDSPSTDEINSSSG